MPLVNRDDNQPQASIQRIPRGPCLLQVRLPVGAPPLLNHSTLGQADPENCCLCADPPACHVNSSPSPASLGRNLHTSNRIPASGRYAAFAFLCPDPVSGDFLVRSDDSVHLPALHSDTISIVGSLRLIWQCRKKKKKKVRIITIEDSSYSPLAGSQCCVWMCRERFQRAPFTIWHFQRMFQPSEGHLFKVCVSLEQNRCPLGKTDTSEEQEWKEQKGKKAKKRSGERRVFPFC